ncbi:unnamed protein product [Caenorhabditis nigoni]
MGRHWSLEGCYNVVYDIFSGATGAPGAHWKFSGKGIFVYDLIFSIDEEKVLNVFTEVVEKENGRAEYLVHFKVDPIL